MNEMIDEQALDEIDAESQVRYVARDRRKDPWRFWYCRGCRRGFKKGKPVPIPSGDGPVFVRHERTKKPFLLGAERKLRSAVRREKARYIHEREAQNLDDESAIGADAAQ